MQCLSGELGTVGGELKLAEREQLLHREAISLLRTVVRLPAAILPIVAEHLAAEVIFLHAADAAFQLRRSKAVIFRRIWEICIFRHSAHRAGKDCVLHVRVRIALETGILRTVRAEHTYAVPRRPHQSRHAIAIHCRVYAASRLRPGIFIRRYGYENSFSVRNTLLENIEAVTSSQHRPRQNGKQCRFDVN